MPSGCRAGPSLAHCITSQNTSERRSVLVWSRPHVHGCFYTLFSLLSTPKPLFRTQKTVSTVEIFKALLFHILSVWQTCQTTCHSFVWMVLWIMQCCCCTKMYDCVVVVFAAQKEACQRMLLRLLCQVHQLSCSTTFDRHLQAWHAHVSLPSCGRNTKRQIPIYV